MIEETIDESIFEPRPLSDYEIRYIRYFIFELGGVARQVQRIVFGWHGPFTMADVRAELHRKFPIIQPPANQLEDCVEGLLQAHWIECVLDGPNGRIFVRARARRRARCGAIYGGIGGLCCLLIVRLFPRRQVKHKFIQIYNSEDLLSLAGCGVQVESSKLGSIR